MRGKSTGEVIGIIIFGAIFIVGLAILFGFVLMWLWNWLMPEIFDLPELSYWQAVGIFILSKLLIGGFGSDSGSKSSSKSDNNCEKKSKKDFSKWKNYNKFWEEKGESYYEEYMEDLKNDSEKEQVKLDIKE
jgi:hypothetical protein